MKKILFSLTVSLVIVVSANCQLTENDISIKVSGLSEEYSAKFKDEYNVNLLLTFLNRFGVPSSVAPIEILVSYDNGQGDVTAKINYNHEEIFSNIDYKLSLIHI